ncbi:hypothetical protein MNEG_9003, partial [Monoraphidium neglectum]
VALCDRSRNPQARVVAMFDMTGGSMANMDVAGMKTILGLLSVHYVERLSAFYFYNPPRVFWGLWGASKHLLPEVGGRRGGWGVAARGGEVTRNKIKVIDPADLAELQAAVPEDVLPVEYGGKAELRPVDAAIRHFGLPPHDAPAGAAADAAAAKLAAVKITGGGSEGGDSADAALVVVDEVEAAGGKAGAVAAAVAPAPGAAAEAAAA